MTRVTAFLSPSPLTLNVSTGRRARFLPQCCHKSPPPLHNRPQFRPLPAVTGAVAGALALVFLPFSSPAAMAAEPKPPTPTKDLRYDGRRELEGSERYMSLGLTFGTFAALSVWAWKKNRREDELEEIRIKEEVERLEKLRAEFMDVEEDDESMDDEDLLASLKQRIEDSEENTDPDSPQEGEGEPKEGGDEVGSDSVDMLKRMWDATDDDQKKKDDKS